MQYAGFRRMIFSFEEHMPPPRWGKLGSSRDRDHKIIRFKYVLTAKLKSVSILSFVSSMYRYRINNCTAFSLVQEMFPFKTKLKRIIQTQND